MSMFRWGICVIVLAVGCGSRSGPELAEVSGTVTYLGQPLSNASVVLVPESGPAAYANTNAEGVFELMTRGRKGAIIGPGKFLVTAGQDSGEIKEEHELTTEQIKKMYKSVIPEKFGRIDQTPFDVVITSNGQNHFQLDLK